MKKKYTIEKFISIFENKISKKKYFDSVHKIKIMTSIEMLKKLNLELQHQ